MEIEYEVFEQPRPKIMVVSHERSGTHFMMNSIALCFQYVSQPWVNLDRSPYPINYFSKTELERWLLQFRGIHLAQIVKSHHPFAFFESLVDRLTTEFQVVYVYRDPRDVMVSFWKFLNQLNWHEGPKVDDARKFVRTEPAGQMLRYQWRQEPTMIHRWRSHVEGWLGVPEPYRSRITYVRFRDLLFDYENVIHQVGQKIGPPFRYDRPTLNDPAIQPGFGKVGTYKQYFQPDDLALFREIAGPTMDRLGYHD